MMFTLAHLMVTSKVERVQTQNVFDVCVMDGVSFCSRTLQ